MSLKRQAKNIKNKTQQSITNLCKPIRIELNSNIEAVIEGGTGVVEYDDFLIRISTKTFEIRITGQSLELECLNNDNIIVKGKISGVEYI